MANIKKFAVKSKKEYEKDGEIKTLWLGVGTLVQFENGNMMLELNMFPDRQFSVFPIEKRDGEWKGREQAKQALDEKDEEINVEDLPF